VNIQFLGKRWTGNVLYGQPVVNKVLADTWPRIQQFIKHLQSERVSAPVFHNRLIPLRQLMMRARSVAYQNHAEFFIIYGQSAAILKEVNDEYSRILLANERLARTTAGELGRAKRAIRSLRVPLMRRPLSRSPQEAS
jgi:hypothetical protein